MDSVAGDVAARRHGEQVRPQGVERLGANAAHAAAQVVVVHKRAARGAAVDDALGQRLADARQLGQFRPLGLVDV